MLRRGSGRIYGVCHGGRWVTRAQGASQSFSLAKEDLPCSASQIVGSSSPFPGSGVTSEQLSLGNEALGRAPIPLLGRGDGLRGL